MRIATKPSKAYHEKRSESKKQKSFVKKEEQEFVRKIFKGVRRAVEGVGVFTPYTLNLQPSQYPSPSRKLPMLPRILPSSLR